MQNEDLFYTLYEKEFNTKKYLYAFYDFKALMIWVSWQGKKGVIKTIYANTFWDQR